MWTTLGLVGLVLMLMASEATNSQNLQTRTSNTSLRVEYNNTQMLLKERTGKTTNSIQKMAIYKNHLVRVIDLDLTWKLQFDIMMFQLPNFDRQWINVLHLTQDGNSEDDNIFKLSIWRHGLHGRLSFKFWKKSKIMRFVLGTKYHVIVEVYKPRRGSKYQIIITIDGEDLVNEHLNGPQRVYNHVKLYCSNPWDRSLPSKIGSLTNFLIPNGRRPKCCKNINLDIDETFLTKVKNQKSLIGAYSYKGKINGRDYWVSANGKSAIWYYPAFRQWMCGHINYLGTSWRGIFSEITSVHCPTQNLKRWNYFDGTGLKADLKSNIHFFCQETYWEKIIKVDCRWSSWGIWSSCSSSCGNGVQSRIRTIARTAKYGGEKCSGRKRGQRSCNQRKCPEHCKWSSWGRWSKCSKSCGEGSQKRQRTVAKTEKHGGKACVGSNTERKTCNTQKCRICPKSKGYKELNGVCYFFSEAHKIFSQAVIDCKQKGGKLAEPKDDRTRKILINNANGYPWIGIKKVGSTWKYVSDGSTVARMKWSSGHPNGAGNCIMIQKGLTGYYDYVCHSTYRYICEF